LTAVKELVDTLNDDRNFCIICRGKFEAGEALSIFGCCGLFYHLECASSWVNQSTHGPATTMETYAICMPCTARWDRDMINGYFPPGEINTGAQSMASGRDVVFIPAGVPPAKATFVYAVTYYGQDGLSILLAEGLGDSSVRQEDLPDRIDEVLGGFTDPMASHQTEDEMVEEWVDEVEDEAEGQVEAGVDVQVDDQVGN
jgi:hypothetical protein